VYTDYVATRWYRSPELLVGDTNYDKLVDVWAAGCMFAEILNGMPLFPGESDIDQLSHIMSCFGRLLPRHEGIFKKNALYVGVKLPAVKTLEPLSIKFAGYDKNIVDIMQKCLYYDSDSRQTCELLLQHKYFDGFKEEFDVSHTIAMKRDREESEAFLQKRKQNKSRAGKRESKDGDKVGGKGGTEKEKEREARRREKEREREEMERRNKQLEREMEKRRVRELEKEEERAKAKEREKRDREQERERVERELEREREELNRARERDLNENDGEIANDMYGLELGEQQRAESRLESRVHASPLPRLPPLCLSVTRRTSARSQPLTHTIYPRRRVVQRAERRTYRSRRSRVKRR
jgi:serine/threonine protein kinase